MSSLVFGRWHSHGNQCGVDIDVDVPLEQACRRLD